MDLTWSEGVNSRKKKPSNRSPNSTASSGLPDISRRPQTVGGEMRNSQSAPGLLGSSGNQKATALQKGAQLRIASFMDRQLSNPVVQARKDMAALQREVVKESKAQDDVKFWGDKGVEGFRVYLRKRFGSIVAGWRVLDVDKNGRLSFYEFCNECRRMGYHGNLKKLWRQLDKDQGGFVSLMEIDPEVGLTVGTFKLALMKKYGDMLTAWKKGLDVNGTGRIEESEIAQCVQNLGIDINPKKLWSFLRSGPGGLGLTLADFDPDAHRRAVTGDFKGLVSAADKEFIEDLPGIGREISLPLDVKEHNKLMAHGGGARQFRREQADRDRKEVADAVSAITRLKLGLHNIDGFKAALINRCGSLLGGWREALDLDGNDRLTFGEFTQALSRLGFHGDVKGLWRQLDSRGMGYIMFGDLDKETDAALTSFKEKLCQEFGNMLLAWMKGFDARGTGICDELQFVRICEKVGFPDEGGSIDGKKLFRLMRPEQGRKFLTLRDVDTKAHFALSRGDYRMLTTQEEVDTRKPTEMTFDERQEKGFFFQIRKAWDAAKRDEFSKACQMANSPEHLIDSNEEFEQLLRRKFGSIASAWRQCLDADHNGKLTFQEFCAAVRSLGYGGDLKALWASYDKDRKGYILLKDMDEDSHTYVSTLRKLLYDRYGDLDAAWRSGFNKDPHDSIDEQELIQACEVLGFPHDPKKLFKCLQPVPGRLLITIWDLDPAEARKKAQGKHNEPVHLNASVPKSPTSKPGMKKPMFGEYSTMDEEGHCYEQTEGGPHNQSTSSRLSANTNYPDTAGALKLVRQAVTKKHGSTVAGWRAHFDPDLSGKVSFGRFVIVLQDCAFHGPVNSVWAALAGERKSIAFKDLDPEASAMLDECRTFMVNECGNILKAWHTVLDSDGLKRVDEAAFCNKMMAKVKRPAKLYRLLLARIGQRAITVEDLEALLIMVPPSERRVIWGGKVETDNQESSKEPSQGSSAKPKQQELATPSPRHHVAKMVTNHHEQDRICTDLEGFKKILINKYGSLFSAWRKALDVDQNGVVCQVDFAKACQKLGVKAVQKLWGEFDKNHDGQISLNEMDPVCAELFNPLEQLLIEQFGSTKDGWKRVFDKEGSLRCDKEKFVAQCKALGFDGDAAKLFGLVRPEPGRPFLAYDDLWINININEFQLNKPEPNTTQGSPRSVRSPPSSPNNRSHH